MNTTVKKVVLVLAGIGFLFIAILLFHIITAKPAVYETPNLQVSRIDFKSDIALKNLENYNVKLEIVE